MIIVTAGHVDHGKSTLVRALTGTDPDRLAEEQRRGMTIDLGFAATEIDGVRCEFVDIPGHHRFIANAVSGAHYADVVLLVISAVEGLKPQTTEHMQIFEALGMRRAVVALTHADLVDDPGLSTVTDEVRARLAGTFASDAPIVSVGLGDDAGLDRLRRAIVESGTSGERLGEGGLAERGLVEGGPATGGLGSAGGRPRLWIDRAFHVVGVGQVVTGTLTGGSLAVAAEMALVGASGSTPVRVRSIQSFGGSSEVGHGGHRLGVALNGKNVEPRRGDALLIAEQWPSGFRLAFALRRLPPGGERPAPGAGEWSSRGGYHLFVGTTHVPVRLSMLGHHDGWALARAIVSDAVHGVAFGDRVVVRDEATDCTVGGGWVLSVDGHGYRRSAASMRARLRVLESGGSIDDMTAVEVGEAGGAMLSDALRSAVGVSTAPPLDADRFVCGSGYVALRGAVADAVAVVGREVGVGGESLLPAGAMGLAVGDALNGDPNLAVVGSVVRSVAVVADASHSARLAVLSAFEKSGAALLSDAELVSCQVDSLT